ncbi:phage integrase N-terminal SAM-like domain-containing protein [Thermodesulfobacteriota bacterium]
MGTSYRTEQSYIPWIKQFILFNEKRHPVELDESHVGKFLSYLAIKRHVSASTQNQALSAILFLYRDVIKKEIGWVDDVERAKTPQRIPVVFSREEAAKTLLQLEGVKWLMVSLLYGSGLRLRECLRLRVKDTDFTYNQIIVRDGKGQKDRITILSEKEE